MSSDGGRDNIYGFLLLGKQNLSTQSRVFWSGDNVNV